MKKIEQRTLICRILAGVLLAGLCLFVVKYFVNGNEWASSAFNRHLYNSQGQLISGTVLDRDGDVLSTVRDGQRVYYDDATVRRATLHVVGDLAGNIGSGAINAFADKLTGFNLISGAYGADQGCNDLYLTIDARYNFIAYQALNGRKGAVAVYNYQTGEILCLVSSPSYDPLNVPEDLESNEKYQGAYLNRFLSSTFTPGSVFKTVTLAAAVERLPDLFERTFTCEGSCRVGEGVITCSGTHGRQDIYAALANSCNVVFSQLAAELGEDTLAHYVKKAGLTDSYSIDGLPSAKGSFALDDISENELGWAGIGQYRDLVNPCSLMVYMGAIANGGQAAEPKIILKTTTVSGLRTSLSHTDQSGTLIEKSTAAILSDMMKNNVVKNYGSDRFPGMDIGAKSGTAEVGEDLSPHAWFCGVLQNEQTPYAFVVLVENGGGGSRVAGAVASTVLDAIVNGY